MNRRLPTVKQALERKTKFHSGYPFIPSECKHESQEWVGNGAGCYNCGIGFWSEPFQDYQAIGVSKKAYKGNPNVTPSEHKES